jgi:hypothetical protein
MTCTLAPLRCPRCGTTAVPVLGRGSGQHAARALLEYGLRSTEIEHVIHRLARIEDHLALQDGGR